MFQVCGLVFQVCELCSRCMGWCSRRVGCVPGVWVIQVFGLYSRCVGYVPGVWVGVSSVWVMFQVCGLVFQVCELVFLSLLSSRLVPHMGLRTRSAPCQRCSQQQGSITGWTGRGRHHLAPGSVRGHTQLMRT